MNYTLKNALIKTQDVSLSFGNRVILKPTTVEVRDIVRSETTPTGQIIGLLGPSGIGKTQFSRMLTGLQEPTSGSIQVVDYANDPTGEKMVPVRPGVVGLVAQNYPLFKHRTVKGNLLVALEKSKLSPKDRLAKAREYLALFELSDKEDRFPVQLSGGQRQRIAIIQALLCSEHFLVLDEPFTGLDPLMRDLTCDLILKVANIDERNTIFVVAHDISALVKISDHLWMFGRDRDEAGQTIPGATIKYAYDLIERGLAWRPGIDSTQEFHNTVTEVKAQFKNL
jgi:NitT/TauT family transport system ATP-binding protein